jgi:hypothetical protein
MQLIPAVTSALRGLRDEWSISFIIRVVPRA